MQFNFVAVAVAALVASAAATTNTTTGGNGATNGTNGTNPSTPSHTPEGNAAFHNALSGGLMGAVVAAGLVLVL